MGCCGHGGMPGSHHTGTQAPPSDTRDLEAILKERLVRGEITAEEYERIRAILTEEPARAAAPARPRPMAGG